MATTVSREHRIYGFGPGMTPAAYVAAGETVVFETSDCYDGQVSLDTGHPDDSQRDRNRGNPATGPIYVQGALPGDMLVVHIERINPAPRGLLFGNDRTGAIRVGRVVDIVDGKVLLPGGFKWPLAPVIGVIGVATRDEVVPNSTPGDHGGNLDTPDIRVGAAVYLPVFEPGGLLALGDVHALQGDGELCGQGVEVAAEVTVRLEVMKGRIAAGPVVKTPTHWAIIASAPDLDEATDLAVLRARDFLLSCAEVKDPEAIMLLSTLADVRISQIVNPLKTVRVCIPRRLAPGW